MTAKELQEIYLLQEEKSALRIQIDRIDCETRDKTAVSKILAGAYSWQEAVDSQGDGWRLPNIFELLDLCEDNTEGTIEGYWSASPYDGNAAYAWFVNFNNGNDFASKKTNSRCVLLIRGKAFACRPVAKDEIKAYKLKQQKATDEIASTTKHKGG